MTTFDRELQASTVIAYTLLAVLVVSAACSARAHDDAGWINRGNFTSPIDGMHCCGVHDCILIPGRDVSQLGRGYFLPTFNEAVPFLEVQTSRDGNFWRCKKPDGSRRCFFAPTSDM